MMMENKKTVICFGEVLWDIFPKGEKIGGAPLNVAYHLNKLGLIAILISRVGRDKYGDDIKGFIEKNKLTQSVIQTDNQYPTGKVEVIIQANHDVKYDIVKPVAWDFIEYNNSINNLLAKADCIVFGSLITRNNVSQNTLFKLLTKNYLKVLDVNLRKPFYSKENLEQLMRKADIIKMNDQELQIISSWFDWQGEPDEKMKALYNEFNLKILMVTHGSKGAYLLHNEQMLFEPGHKIHVADTVGSGDAFLAGFLAEYLSGSPLKTALKMANGMGALIAGKTGGCPEYDKEDIQKIFKSNFITL